MLSAADPEVRLCADGAIRRRDEWAVLLPAALRAVQTEAAAEAEAADASAPAPALPTSCQPQAVPP